MKTIFNFFILIIIISLTFCSDKSEEYDNLDLSIFGLNNSKREYIETILAVNYITNEPIIIPPDSIKDKIAFPESLYTVGIFVYSKVNEQTKSRLNQFTINENTFGYNLYNIICSYPSNGEFGTQVSYHYTIEKQKVYLESRFLFELPLDHDTSYVTITDSIKINCGIQINTLAGTFNTVMVEIDAKNTSGLKQVTRSYFAKNIGVVLKEETYLYNEIIDSSYQSITIKQYRKREMQSYSMY